jgi:hypothetical protein
MAEDDPNCPRCTGPVRLDWDWCQNCGYDPERLKPIGWIPEPPPEPDTGGRRRSRRAKSASRGNGPTRTPAHHSTLLVLPPSVLDLTRVDEPVAASTPTATITSEFSLPANGVERGFVAILAAVAALLAVVALSSVGSLARGTTLNTVATSMSILVCLVLAVGLAAQAYALVKVRVIISPTHLTVRNRLGLPCRATLSEIFSVTLSTRHFDIGFGHTHAAEVPYVQVSDGAGFWIDALGGRSGESPTVEQRAVLDHLNRIVATHRPVPPPLDLPR